MYTYPKQITSSKQNRGLELFAARLDKLFPFYLEPARAMSKARLEPARGPH